MGHLLISNALLGFAFLLGSLEAKRPHRPPHHPLPPKAQGTGNLDFVFSTHSARIIHPHSNYEVHVSVEKSNGPVDIEVRLNKGNGNGTVAKSRASLDKGESIIVTLNVLDLPDELYNLTLTATSVNSKKSYVDYSFVYTDPKTLSMLIQTDKPIYKPGESVQFRVLFLDRNLRPTKPPPGKKIQIFARDSQNNIVKSWIGNETMLKNAFGLIRDSLILSKEPNLGEWSLEAKSGDDSHTQTFSVDEYVLPKFKVEVKTKPSFVTYNSSKFVAELTATYTHGKGVKSLCSVSLRPTYSNDYNYSPDVVEVDSNGNTISSTSDKKRRHLVTRTLDSEKGKENVNFDLKADLLVKYEDAYDYGNDYTIDASCTDVASGKVQNATTTIKMYKYPWVISTVDDPANYKPGFPLNLTIKVATQDDKPVFDKKSKALKIVHGFAYNADKAVIWRPIPQNGLVTVTFSPPTNELLNVNGIEATYKDLTQYLGVPSRQNSATKSYMVITPTDKGPLKAGKAAEFLVKMNKPFTFLHYIVVSKGVTVKWERISMDGAGSKAFTLQIDITKEMAPSSQLLVYTILPDQNDVAAEPAKFDVKLDHLKGSLKLTVSKTNVEPGANITINCNGHKNSLIALRGVDQSVLLLKEDRDITQNSLRDIENDFQNAMSGTRNWGGSDTYQTFENMGLVILTNALISKNEYPQYRRQNYYEGGGYGGEEYDDDELQVGGMMEMEDAAPARMMMKARPMAMAMNNANFAMVSASSYSSNVGAVVRLRKEFPETWIFQELNTNDRTQATLHKMVPDTITSWMISGFQLNADEGISLTDEATKLTVFRPFFIVLNLPYSVVKGEIFKLEVLVYNYGDKTTDATVTLDNKDNSFSFVSDDSGSQTASVESQGTSIVSFLITPTKIGTITLNVKAVATSMGDMVQQPLIVKAPGVKQCQNNAVFVNLLKESTFKTNLSAVFPPSRVEGGDTIKVVILGDILGGTLQNLDQLIRLPYGCGEQNMINFVPDIVILDYLKATDNLKPDVKNRAIEYLESGYQRELTFKRYDGSYAAFGNSEAFGSTWLTAFVVKSFLQAKRYIWVDHDVLSLAMEFLKRSQAENGSFIEEGYVHDSDLQGQGAQGSYALTAYVLLTFVQMKQNGNFTSTPTDPSINPDDGQQDQQNQQYDQNGNPISPKSFDDVINLGLKFLLQGGKKKMQDTYSIILTTYLLHQLNHKMKDEFFKRMEEHAILAGDYKFWQQKLKKSDPWKDGGIIPMWYWWSPWEYTQKPASVEMTAYALLVHLMRETAAGSDGDLKESLKIAQWLIKQRNGEGGFQSTQDTVVGLMALGKFAEATNTPQYGLSVAVQVAGGTNFETSLSRDNMTTLAEYFLPDGVTSVDIVAGGKGTALAQLSWNYYTMDCGNYSGFTLDVKVEAKDKNRRLEMQICTSFVEKSGKSNMAILEVNTPTGYSFDADDLTQLDNSGGGLIKRHETDDGDTKLHIYLDHLTKDKLCLNVIARRVHLVAKHAKSSVQIYDYYDTTRKVQTFYDGPVIDVCEICSLDNSCRVKKCVRK